MILFRRSFIVSNDYLHTSLVSILSGRISDYEKHKGDEVVNVIKGEMNVVISEEENDSSVSAESFNLKEEEKLVIPEGYKHRFLNLTKYQAGFILLMYCPQVMKTKERII